MKRLIFLFILLRLFSKAQTDTILSGNGEITSIHETGIYTLFKKYENILKARNGIEGWRVQLAFKEKKEDAEKINPDLFLEYFIIFSILFHAFFVILIPILDTDFKLIYITYFYFYNLL